MASNISNSLIRLNGLSSGLDTESIVKSLLKIDQMKVDKQFKLKEKLQWKGDAYRSINLKLKSFQDTYMKLFSTSSTNMLDPAKYNAYSVTMQTQTNAVSITAGSNASVGALTISDIKLATAPQVSSSGMFADDKINGNSTLKEAFGEGLFEGGNISFSINGKEFTFSEDTTIFRMMNQINSSDAGVTMSYSSLKKGFTIASKVTGESGKVVIDNLSGTAFSSASTGFKIGEVDIKGENAKATIDGVTVERNSNTFTIDGITYTLKEDTNTGETIKFSVARDVGEVFDKIKDFIDSYNSVIEELHAKLDESVYSDYEPLTDAEREEMSETQINKWEEKAKSGTLSNDNGIRALLQEMRSAFYNVVEGAGKSAASIGLETGYKAMTGKIVINEAKLKEALANNPDQVASIFSKASSATDGSTKYNESGLAVRLSNSISNYISNSTQITLENNAQQLKNANSRLDQLEDWLTNNEQKYYARFTAMETALAKLNSQTGWISSLLGSSSS